MDILNLFMTYRIVSISSNWVGMNVFQNKYTGPF